MFSRSQAGPWEVAMTWRFRCAPSASWSLGVGSKNGEWVEPSVSKKRYLVTIRRVSAPLCCKGQVLYGHARFLGMRAQVQEVFNMCNLLAN